MLYALCDNLSTERRKKKGGGEQTTPGRFEWSGLRVQSCRDIAIPNSVLPYETPLAVLMNLYPLNDDLRNATRRKCRANAKVRWELSDMLHKQDIRSRLERHFNSVQTCMYHVSHRGSYKEPAPFSATASFLCSFR
jgi:hypothetical protein